MSRRSRIVVALLAFLVVILVGIYTQLTLFVVQPIGAVPRGRTVVMLRLSGTKFIDSADAMCDRMASGVSLLCRGIVLGKVLENATIIARLPYSQTLYDISTGGKRYPR